MIAKISPGSGQHSKKSVSLARESERFHSVHSVGSQSVQSQVQSPIPQCVNEICCFEFIHHRYKSSIAIPHQVLA